MPKNSAMQRWEEQQRLKLMSKKIAGAKSVLKSEKIIGPGKNGRKNTPSPYGTPYESDDSGFAADAFNAGAQKKGKGRPQWQDINHVSYRVESSNRKAARARPARLDIRTPEEARNALMKGLDRIEEVVEKAKKSPKKAMQAVAGHFEDLQQMRKDVGQVLNKKKSNPAAKKGGMGLRKQLAEGLGLAGQGTEGSGMKGQAAEPAKGQGGDAVDMLTCENDSDDEGFEVDELRRSINALSSLLDSKLKTLQDANIEDETAANRSMAEDDEGSPNVSVVNRHGIDDSADICQHCEDDEDEAEADTDNVLGAEAGVIDEKLGVSQGLATGTYEYDDEFEEEEETEGAEIEGAQDSQVPNDVISALEATASKIELLDSLISDKAQAQELQEQKENNAVNPQNEGSEGADKPLDLNDLTPKPSEPHDPHANGGAPEVSAQTASPEAHGAAAQPHAQATAQEDQAPAAPQAAPIRPFASKPFSFKAKGPTGGGLGQGQPQIDLFSNGITLLNSVNHKPLLSQPSADTTGTGNSAAQVGQEQHLSSQVAKPQGSENKDFSVLAPSAASATASQTPEPHPQASADRPGGQGISAADIKKAMQAAAAGRQGETTASQVPGGQEPETEEPMRAQSTNPDSSTLQSQGSQKQGGYSISTARPNRAARGMFLNQPSAEVEEQSAPSNARGGRGLLFSAPKQAEAPAPSLQAAEKAEEARASAADTDSQAMDSASRGNSSCDSRPLSGRKKISAAEIKKAMMARKEAGGDALGAEAEGGEASSSTPPLPESNPVNPVGRRQGRGSSRLLTAEEPSSGEPEPYKPSAPDGTYGELPGAMRTIQSTEFTGVGGPAEPGAKTKDPVQEEPKVMGVGRMKGRMWQQLQDARPDASLEVIDAL